MNDTGMMTHGPDLEPIVEDEHGEDVDKSLNKTKGKYQIPTDGDEPGKKGEDGMVN